MTTWRIFWLENIRNGPWGLVAGGDPDQAEMPVPVVDLAAQEVPGVLAEGLEGRAGPEVEEDSVELGAEESALVVGLAAQAVPGVLVEDTASPGEAVDQGLVPAGEVEAKAAHGGREVGRVVGLAV
jgi:hypothetical protein